MTIHYRYVLLLAIAVSSLNTLVLGLPTVLLSACFVVCSLIWASREWQRVPGLVAMGAAMTVVLSLHFVEELKTGFAEQFPALFARHWSLDRFIAFNLAWLIIFAICTFVVTRNVGIAFLGLLFLAIGGGIANGIGHIVLVILSGRMFPGIYTAPLLIATGLLLVLRLWRASRQSLGQL